MTPSQRLVKADALLKEASQRLEKHKHTIDSANYTMAQGLLQITSDHRVGLEDKGILRRHQQVQVYNDKVQETYKTIEELTSGLY